MSDSVLIVEDTASTGILYQSWLKKAGISGRCVEDGASAMAELRKGGYRLMLLDLQLPDINGLEILRRDPRRGDSNRRDRCDLKWITEHGCRRYARRSLRLRR